MGNTAKNVSKDIDRLRMSSGKNSSSGSGSSSGTNSSSGTSSSTTSGTSSSSGAGTGNTLQTNKVAGDAYEREVLNNMSNTHNNVQQQITVKTQSGVKTRIDIIGQNKQTGVIDCVECKASPTAPLTKNQKQAFPEIAQSGATVVGKGKPPYTNGYQIPPSQVNINRKK
ncbi:hypothetical protein J2T15_000098 [Paenibacillus harenae]|uniref:Tox-REase-7 domain-containing protein n=1 Tax=Paenibacillus harenae TaxID=306543 RepID=A0ABT9TUE4_PAEHA|nr:hypothetical protein [Paenibacillus harenae]